MKKLLTIAAILVSFQASAFVDLSGTGITTTNNGYHFTAKIAVKGITTAKIEVLKDSATCSALAEEYKATIKVINTKAGNTDVKIKTTCATNKTGRPIGYKISVPAGVFNS